jgi:hypothetical protein
MLQIPLSLVILEVMWGPANGARNLFQINPNNHSGRRLYKIMPGRFLVGDACPGIVSSAKERGIPSVDHLESVFDYAIGRGYTLPVVVIGGKIARETFEKMPVKPEIKRVMFIPHPAARAFWTKEIEALAKEGLADEKLNRLTLTKNGWKG